MSDRILLLKILAVLEDIRALLTPRTVHVPTVSTAYPPPAPVVYSGSIPSFESIAAGFRSRPEIVLGSPDDKPDWLRSSFGCMHPNMRARVDGIECPDCDYILTTTMVAGIGGNVVE